MLRLLAWSCLLLLLSAAPLEAQDLWGQADLQTRRLPPSAFQQLPPLIRADLEHRRCTIPQLWDASAPGNVVHGHFRAARGTDWAVLCSVNRASTLLVYWGGRVDSVDQLAPAPDKTYLQGVAGGRIGFSRAIGAVDASVVREHHRYGEAQPPPLMDHDGISDAFVEKASIVWYWYQGKWLELPGAD
jgi:hypothetical protein